jgi:hypothetical protein
MGMDDERNAQLLANTSAAARWRSAERVLAIPIDKAVDPITNPPAHYLVRQPPVRRASCASPWTTDRVR